jgi:uncharacterized protein YlxW (UPF0749 family)
MKKILIASIAIMTIMSFTGCQDKEQERQQQQTDVQQQENMQDQRQNRVLEDTEEEQQRSRQLEEDHEKLQEAMDEGDFTQEDCEVIEDPKLRESCINEVQDITNPE